MWEEILHNWSLLTTHVRRMDNVAVYQNGVYTHNINVQRHRLYPPSTLAREFGTSKLTLHFAPTTVNMHCNVLTFGRIVISLFPRIRVISPFITFNS